MSKIFLTAQWRNLLMANYAVDPAILKPYVPVHTELDAFKGMYYVSLVGFLFQDVRVHGLAIPFHTTFEEVNLRFYVRCKDGNEWKRGVVFMKEIVPRHAITFVANTLYNENYATHSMKHVWAFEKDAVQVAYHWKVGADWNYLKAVADTNKTPVTKGSAEEFITEHYWGYTFVNKQCTGVYEVAHPQWNIHAVTRYEIKCDAARLYGNAFAQPLSKPPQSVFLADGSAIKVMGGTRLFKR